MTSLPPDLPANYTTGQQFTAAAEDTDETDINEIVDALGFILPWSLRQTGGHQVPAAMTYWANKIDTTTLPTTEDTGQATSSAPTGGVTGKIASGLLTFTPASGTGPSDLYYQWNAGAPVTRIGCRFILGHTVGTTTNGALALAMANQTVANIGVSGFSLPVHLSMTSTNLQVTSYTQAGGFSAPYINYVFPKPLTIDTTVYEVEIFLVGSVLTVIAPDGSVLTATQSVFNGAGQGNWGFIEPGCGVSNTDNIPGIQEHWWDTSTTLVAPTAQLATAAMVKNAVYSPNADVLPAPSGTYSLGGASNYWLDAFVDNYIGYNIFLYNLVAGNYVALAAPSTASGTTVTLPNATDTLVGRATTDTLTNKTLTSPVITGPAARIGDIVHRGTPRATPELWMTFADKANATTMPATFDSGQVASWCASYGTNAQQFINNGLLTTAPTGAGQAGGFVAGQISGNVTRIGARFVFSGGTTNGAAVVLGITQSLVTQAEATGGTFPPFAVHLACGMYGWGLYYIDTTHTVQTIATGVLSPAPVNDGVTQYEIEAWVVGNTCTILLPDGSLVSYTDSHIGTYAGPYVFFQNHLNVANTDDVPAFTHFWAQSGPQNVLPNEQSTTGVASVNTGTALASAALTIDAAVHTLLTSAALGIGTWLVSASVVCEQSAASAATVDFAVALGTAVGSFLAPVGFTAGGGAQFSSVTVGVQTVVKITTPGTLILKYQSSSSTGGVVVPQTGISHNLGSSTGLTAVRLA